MRNKQEILNAIANGDRSAFQEMYQLFSERVYNTALSYAQNKEDAEEITQDVFISIFKNAAKFKAKSAVSTWVYRITVNTSLNLIKKRKRTSTQQLGIANFEEPDFIHPGVLLEQKENAQYLFKAIDTLPDKQKTAFILSFVEGLPRKKVADIMDMGLKAVESLLQRAKGNLRKSLELWYNNRRK